MTGAIGALAAAAAVALLPAPVPAQTIAITGGTIYPVAGPRIERGTVLIRDGRIAAVGANVAVPAGATVVDATGKWITPGLVHARAEAGLGIGSLSGFSEAGVQGDVTPSFTPAEGFDPDALTIPVARTGGITTGLLGPRGNFLPGRMIAVDFAGDRLEELLLSPAAGLVINLTASSREAGGGSRAGTLDLLRRLFADARELERREADWRRDQIQPLAAPARELAALLPALNGRMPVAIMADREMDIRAALRITAEYRLRTILYGAAEGWKLADEIAAARVPVALEPNRDIPNFGALGARLDNPALLRAAGVEVIIAQDDPGGERNLRFIAGNAVRNGMTWDDALRAVTLAPARAYGLTDRGALEPGRVANLVVWSGDPFDFAAAPERVYIRGRETSLRTRETELLERYRTLPVRY